MVSVDFSNSRLNFWLSFSLKEPLIALAMANAALY